jgi:hypothetical protein
VSVGFLSSKSSGKKAVGALWKSTTTARDLRFSKRLLRVAVLYSSRGEGIGPWSMRCAQGSLMLPDRFDEEKLLAILAMLNLRITEFAEARIVFSGRLIAIPG